MPGLLRGTVAFAFRITVGAAVALVALSMAGSALGQVRMLTVLSGSMRPKFLPGSVLIARPLSGSRIRTGDVITFSAPGGAVVTHRVVQIVSEPNGTLAAKTKGDANNVADSWSVPLIGTVWRTVATVPLLGYPLLAVRHISMFRVLTIAAPALLGMVWLIQIWRPQPAFEDRNTDALA